jgi:hypothetical protein
MGVGSEVYAALLNGRRGIGIELKPSYFRQAKRNVEDALRGWTSGAQDDQLAIESTEASDEEEIDEVPA